MATKKTNSAPANAAAKSATTDATVHSELAGASSIAQDGAGANSTDTPESEAASTQTVGTGNSAGPAIRLTEISHEDIGKLLGGDALAFVADADGNLRVAEDIEILSGKVDAFVLPEGFDDWADVVAAAKVGEDVIDVLRRAVGPAGVLGDLPVGINTAGCVEWMLGRISDLTVQLNDERRKVAVPADVKGTGKRGFMLIGNVRLNNKLRSVGETVWLTVDEHAELYPSKAVHEDWETGLEG